MKKSILYIIFFITFYQINHAQSVSKVDFRQQGRQIKITYDLTGAVFNQSFNVSLYVSTDGGRNFEGPLQKVTGDVGFGIQAGMGKTITWNVLEEMPAFGGNVVFDVRAVVREKKIKRKMYITYKGSLSAPLGIMIGLTGKTGFYVSARINQDYGETTKYETDGEKVVDYEGLGFYGFPGDETMKRLSLTAGMTFQVGRKLHLYFGGGYAVDELLWKIDEYDYSGHSLGSSWVFHQEESFAGFEAEAGLMLEFGHVMVGAGFTTPGVQYVEPVVTAGIRF